MKLTDQDTIVLADFTNRTSDPVFDDALNTALRVELKQTPFLNVLGSEKADGALKQMGRAEDTKLTPEVAREVCLRTNSKAVVEGSITDAGSRYRIGLRATDCQSGKAVASTEVGVASRNQIVRALGVAGVELRRSLGEPRESLRRFDKPLDEATSSSLEAVQALTQGGRQRSSAAALPYFRRSVVLDPNFAASYAALGGAYNDLGETILAAENVKKAYELRGRVEESRRLSIESTYYFNVTAELDKAIAVNQELAKTYPGDSGPHNKLSFILRIVGRPQEAVVEALEARRLQPGSYGPIFNLMMAYIELNRFDDAKATFEEASASDQGAPLLRLTRYVVAFLQSDDRARQEQLTWALARPELGHQIISLESESQAYFGHLRKADALSRAAVQAATKAKLPEAAAEYLATEARREAEIGNSALARSRQPRRWR